MGNKDAEIAAVAQRQHGLITATQLEAIGLGRSAVAKRATKGSLHRVHRGVYAVGHPGLSSKGRWMAAVLAAGEGAFLSHRSAAELWRLLEPTPGVVHVTVPTSAGRRQRPGLRIHRSPSLQIQSTTMRSGIPVTTVARTLRDLAGAVTPATRRRAIRQADYFGFDTGLETDRTRSEGEAMFLRLCRRHCLEIPEVNVPIGRYTVDFLWRRQRLVVETGRLRGTPRAPSVRGRPSPRVGAAGRWVPRSSLLCCPDSPPGSGGRRLSSR